MNDDEHNKSNNFSISLEGHSSESKALFYCAVIMLIAFVLPWISAFGEGVSGYNLGSLGSYGNYAWIVPILCIATIGTTFSGKPNTEIAFFNGAIPLGAIVYFIWKLSGRNIDFDSLDNILEAAFQILSIGAWLTILTSVVMVVISLRSFNARDD